MAFMNIIVLYIYFFLTSKEIVPKLILNTPLPQKPIVEKRNFKKIVSTKPTLKLKLRLD